MVNDWCFSGYIPVCKQSTAVQAKKEPEKVEVFVDGKPVQVEPNSTVLQVKFHKAKEDFLEKKNYHWISSLGMCCCWCRDSTLLLS